MNGTIPAGTGGAWRTAADGQVQGDGRIYVPGDSPWFEPMLFDQATNQPVPGQDGQSLGPLHAPLRVVANATGDAWRFENVGPWSAGGFPGTGGGSGATPQAPYSPGGDSVSAALNSIDAGLATLRAILGK